MSPEGEDIAPSDKDNKKIPGRYPELKEEINHTGIPTLGKPVSTGKFRDNVPVLDEMVNEPVSTGKFKDNVPVLNEIVNEG